MAEAVFMGNAPSILSSWATERIELLAALGEFVKRFGQADTWILAYSPTECFFGRLDVDGVPRNDVGPVKLDLAFEVRSFNAKAELRWLREPDGTTRAVVISEVPGVQVQANHGVPGKPDQAQLFAGSPTSLYASGTCQATYLLWGQSDGPATPGWSQFSAARIGPYRLPLEIPKGSRALLLAREYFAVFEDGNTRVAEERLTGLGLAPSAARG